MHQFPVHGDCFHVAVREFEYRAAGGFIHAAALHSDKAVFHYVNSADSVLAADFIERAQNVGGFHCFAVYCNAIAFFKSEFEIHGLVGRVLRGDCCLEHVFIFGDGRVKPRVFENAGFVGNMEHISVH